MKAIKDSYNVVSVWTGKLYLVFFIIAPCGYKTCLCLPITKLDTKDKKSIQYLE